MSTRSSLLKCHVNFNQFRRFSLVMVLLVSGIWNSAASGSDVYVPAKYVGVSLQMLISTYRGAYLKAGFKLTKETTMPHYAGHGARTRLEFSFALPEFPNSRGSAYIDLDVDDAEKKKLCAPCLISRGWNADDAGQYGEEFRQFSEQLRLRVAIVTKDIDRALSKFDSNRSERRYYQDPIHLYTPGVH